MKRVIYSDDFTIFFMFFMNFTDRSVTKQDKGRKTIGKDDQENRKGNSSATKSQIRPKRIRQAYVSREIDFFDSVQGGSGASLLEFRS